MKGTLLLKRGRERSLEQRHPWIFSGAVERLIPGDDDVVEVRAADGRFLARAYVNEDSQIVARVLTFDDEPVGRALFARRIDDALAWRARMPGASASTAGRLVNAEGDALPGLVVDRYGDVVVLQALTRGIERRKAMIAELLMERTEPRALYERSDVDVRRKEGLEEVSGLLAGAEPPPRVEIIEHGRRFLVDVRAGHKTGFYLDQRENRALSASLASGAADVLNAFCYTGAFGIYAATAGARHVVQLDASEAALALAAEHARLNDVDEGVMEHIAGDAFALLRSFRDQRRSFDVIVLDPPKLAASKAKVEAACRGYKDLNLLALKLLRPGGLLFTFSCSGAIERELFHKVVHGAAVDARRDVEVLVHLSQGSDHPYRLSFPEGAYLKGLVGRVAVDDARLAAE